MDDDEPLLLHEPDLMLALMRAAQHGPAGIDDAAMRITAMLAVAREATPVDQADLRRRLERAAGLLRNAGALSVADGGTFRLTETGVRLLAEHPDGVDQSVLERLPEFRAYLAAHAREHEAPADRREPAFDTGFRAFSDGRPMDANPFDPDTPDHQAWANGWCDGRDRRGRGEE